MSCKKIYFVLMALLLVGISSCNKAKDEILEEDYESLFPFQGIDDPEMPSEGFVIRQGNINLTQSTFHYEGNDSIKNKLTYNITLKYKLKEDSEGVGKSRYVVRFVNKDKKLVSISSNASTNYLPNDEYEKGEKSFYIMPNGKTQTISFKAQSGFQLLLCVNGAGPRNSSIIARITAEEENGLVNPFVLSTEQYQNEEGQASLPSPFCKYLILP